MKALVVGMGSIGRRHAEVLAALGCQVAVVSARQAAQPRFTTIVEAIDRFGPDYAVVANETAAHEKAVRELAASGFRGRLLVEKPLACPAALGAAFGLAAVGYNLRMHPLLRNLAAALAGQRLVSMQAYAGQYLPDWRPGSDYRASYSADPRRGGGVLRDLSHELDYLTWLAGRCARAAALGGRHGSLEIASDDTWGVLLELERCPVASVQLNYHDRAGRRCLIVNTAEHTYCADLVRGVLATDREESRFEVQRDDTYRAEHEAMLSGNAQGLCTFEEAETLTGLMAAIERSAQEKKWVRP